MSVALGSEFLDCRLQPIRILALADRIIVDQANLLGFLNHGDARDPLLPEGNVVVVEDVAGNARGYRAVGRLDDAEKIQLALASERPADGEQSGYVFEELAELTYAKGDKDAAKAWAAKAYNLLRDDPDMAAETERLRRLLNLSQGRAP